jgi:hypothetical protein
VSILRILGKNELESVPPCGCTGFERGRSLISKTTFLEF